MMRIASSHAGSRPGSRLSRGAALLAAMLTLTLVASLAAGAAWQQWRGVETERAERERGQAAWMLIGALDWARLILRADTRTGGPDYLGEPWSLPIKESRITSFLAADASSAVLLADQAIDNVFLSGHIDDAQARLNIRNLIDAGGSVSPVALAAFEKLFDLQGLNRTELEVMKENYRFAADNSPSNLSGALAPLPPQRLDEITLLGLSSASLERLRPFIIWLPEITRVNVNTASVEVLYASVPGLDLDGARKIVAARQKQPFRTLTEVTNVVPALAGQFGTDHSVMSEFFEITGQLRFADGKQSMVVTERSLVERKALNTRVLWRERGSFPVTEGELTAEQITGSRR
jgi:general secretion pathway protein K